MESEHGPETSAFSGRLAPLAHRLDSNSKADNERA